jgi:leucyl aminopeptidase
METDYNLSGRIFTGIVMLARLQIHAGSPRAAFRKHRHVLVVLPAQPAPLADEPDNILAATLTRRKLKRAELAKKPLSANLADGGLVAWCLPDSAHDRFQAQASMRAALDLLLAERPGEIAIVTPAGPDGAQAAELALYCAWVNGVCLPQRKSKGAGKPLQAIHLYGARLAGVVDAVHARAEGNVLCRELTALPPNELTPGVYRRRVRALARDHKWKYTEFDFARLRRMGAGAFCAVAQGSPAGDAAIVHLRYTHAKAKRTVALVGKGICYDTGGHNLKPARYMFGMHEDMNGSAVALGILLAATRQKLAVNIDCWLAISRNDISPRAYHQNEVVTALNGTTIEITHTDAEGRMVLADTLTLAARGKPDLMVDFATLTGSMHAALGNRYSGAFATSDELAARAVTAGRDAGERLCMFPFDDDYDEALDSKIADVKQCTLNGDADHILAAMFLKRFTGGTPWVHVDLSASSCKGGLGAVASDLTGFGVAWGLGFINQ